MEIIIVLFLVVLIVGMSSVFFSHFLPSVKFNAVGKEMVGMIRHARSLARMKMEAQTFVIDLDRKTYGIEGRPARLIPRESSIRVLDPFYGEIIQGKYAIVFNPTGNSGGGIIMLSLRKKLLKIEIDPITGAALGKEGR